ncbi:MAG TPA: hypothetical protein IAA20_09590 [Candidatus Enterococcus avicola]|uniref:DUF1878 family protein n=1 Tax=Candidatus Enterococcus avicola TaxID=2838561 RepID=A0A9D2F9C3_9ENTE|nr:hypothetical protein [Candidatus Enterococcus avicola]
MANLETEISLLKYKMKLLMFFIDDNDEYPFFQFCLNYDIREEQEKALIKILGIYNYRYKGVENEFHKNGVLDNDLKGLLSSFNLKLEDLYVELIPTFQDFQKVVSSIFGTDTKADSLLGKLIKQSIHEELCEYLLKNK